LIQFDRCSRQQWQRQMPDFKYVLETVCKIKPCSEYPIPMQTHGRCNCSLKCCPWKIQNIIHIKSSYK
jgi:hypothetical protein